MINQGYCGVNQYFEKLQRILTLSIAIPKHSARYHSVELLYMSTPQQCTPLAPYCQEIKSTSVLRSWCKQDGNRWNDTGRFNLLTINLLPTYSLILNNTCRYTITFYVKCNIE